MCLFLIYILRRIASRPEAPIGPAVAMIKSDDENVLYETSMSIGGARKRPDDTGKEKSGSINLSQQLGINIPSSLHSARGFVDVGEDSFFRDEPIGEIFDVTEAAESRLSWVRAAARASLASTLAAHGPRVESDEAPETQIPQGCPEQETPLSSS